MLSIFAVVVVAVASVSAAPSAKISGKTAVAGLLERMIKEKAGIISRSDDEQDDDKQEDEDSEEIQVTTIKDLADLIADIYRDLTLHDLDIYSLIKQLYCTIDEDVGDGEEYDECMDSLKEDGYNDLPVKYLHGLGKDEEYFRNY